MSDLKKDLLKQCSCGSGENNFYICTYTNCNRREFVCPYCLIEHHSEHAPFCIPINYFKMQDLSESSVKKLQNIEKLFKT